VTTAKQNSGTGQKKAPSSTHDIDRAHESRVDETSEVHATHLQRPLGPWERPSNLDAPPARPGMVQRWIRITQGGEDDPRNVSRRRREGWTPRPLSTIPSEYKEMVGRSDSREGVFVVDDLMLCEQPIELAEQRAAYIQAQTERQMLAVTADLDRSQVAGHPITREHRSAVQGRKLAPAADED
jgi:hypothetical protein